MLQVLIICVSSVDLIWPYFFRFKVLFATCFDPNTLSELQGHEGKVFSFKTTSADVTYRYFLFLVYELHVSDQ